MGQVQSHSHRRAVVIGGQRITRDGHSGTHSAGANGQRGCAWILVEIGPQLGLNRCKRQQAQQEQRQENRSRNQVWKKGNTLISKEEGKKE